MSRARGTIRLLRHATIVGLGDRAALFAPRTWVLVWSVRVLAEMAFYALIGRLLGSASEVAYLLVGSAVVMACTTTMQSVQTMAWERLAGTLPLLVASPSGPFVPFLGRSVMWIPDAMAFSFGGLLLAGTAFGVELPAAGLVWVALLLLACILGTYGLASFVGALVLRNVNARNLASHLGRMLIVLVSGAIVPVGSLPAWAQWVSPAIPATHALRGIRTALVDVSPGSALGDLALTLLVGGAWMALAGLCIGHFADRARTDGSIELGGE